MKSIQTSQADITRFVDELFADGKNPCDAFGISWEQLCQLEKEVPEITVRTAPGERRFA